MPTQPRVLPPRSGHGTAGPYRPPVALPREPGSSRLLHIHRNTPGVLATVDGVLAGHGINIEGQLLATRGEYGYVVTDIGVLDWLPRRELLSGVFEALKGGVIGDPELFALLETPLALSTAIQSMSSLVDGRLRSRVKLRSS